jgi:hypothetical protein
MIGDDRSGRTSTLMEFARRAGDDRGQMVVSLRLVEDDLTRSGLVRALLTATVERLVQGQDPVPDWYRAWSDRVHLRDRSPMTVRDVLVSGLAFAADSAAVLDPAVLDRDLRALVRLAQERGHSGIVVSIDDGDPLLEDVALAERFIQSLDPATGWSLVIATGLAGVGHLVEAVSPCLRRLQTVPLMPFFTLDQIRTCLTAPLDSAALERLIPDNDLPLLLDLHRLTAGNPFEIALVARQLWVACGLREQEHYELTPRVLERVVQEISLYTGTDEALVDGASAVSRLAPDRIGPALDLVALSRLTTRQVAVARVLGLPNRDDNVNDRLLRCDLDADVARVVEELTDLEREGVVALTDNGQRFTVQGGRAVALSLKYQARSLLGPDVADKSFDTSFLRCVGQPLAKDCAGCASELIDDAGRLGWLALHSPTDAAAGARLRSALDAEPFAGLELDLGVDVDVVPFSQATFTRMTDLLIDAPARSLVVLQLTVAADGTDLDWIELWEGPIGLDTHEVNQALSDVLEKREPLVSAAGLTWRGSRAVVLDRDAARRALIQLAPHAAPSAVMRLFGDWWKGERADGLERAVAVAREAVEAMRAQRVPDWERRWETSNMLSRLGFLLSLFEDRIEDARTALTQAQECGPGDGWVTNWNLANLAARLGEFDDAKRRLEEIEERLSEWGGEAYVVFFVPGRPAQNSLVKLTSETSQALFALQLAIIERSAGRDDSARVSGAINACRELPNEDAHAVAEWITSDASNTGVPPNV